MTYEQYTYTVENPSAIRSIVLTDADVPVEVLSSGDSSMHANYFESDKEKYDIEIDGDTLYIRKKVQFMIGFFMFRNSPDDMRLTMYLPVGYAGELNIATADGDIRVYGVTASDVAMKTTDGNIIVNRSHINGNATCKTIDGGITVGSITASGVFLKTTDGDILLDRPLISSKLSCRAVDGDIKGLLAGRPSDYTFIVRTGDGHSNIISGGKGRTYCEVKTTDGDIEVSFEDDD